MHALKNDALDLILNFKNISKNGISNLIMLKLFKC